MHADVPFCHSDCQCARSYFPRGLLQPAGGLRFGADALLLAAFAAQHIEKHPPRRDLAVADLGCGCGAVLLGLALRCPRVQGIGLEKEDCLVNAALHNAQLLALRQRVHFSTLNLANTPELVRLRHPLHDEKYIENALDMALANPPFTVQGRAAASPLREKALRQESGAENTLDIFCRAAAVLLRHHAYFFCIYTAAALPNLCIALDKAHLGLQRALPIAFRPQDTPQRVLVMARKNAAHHLCIAPTLTLHTAQSGAAPTWSAAALDFCPWLGAGRTMPETEPPRGAYVFSR